MTTEKGEQPQSRTGVSSASQTIRSVRTHRFKKLFDGLPARVQKSAIDRYENYFVVNPFHPLLENHKLYDVDDAHARSVAVTIFYGYRAVAAFEESTNTYIWYWCGTHGDYDTRFRKGR